MLVEHYVAQPIKPRHDIVWEGEPPEVTCNALAEPPHFFQVVRVNAGCPRMLGKVPRGYRRREGEVCEHSVACFRNGRVARLRSALCVAPVVSVELDQRADRHVQALAADHVAGLAHDNDSMWGWKQLRPALGQDGDGSHAEDVTLPPL